MKFSQYPTVTTILMTSYALVLQAGSVAKITIANLLSGYYTKSEVDAICPWQNVVLTAQTIVRNTPKSFTHNLDNEDFDYTILFWSSTKSKYLKPQLPFVESDRTADTVELLSTMDHSNFKIIFFG